MKKLPIVLLALMTTLFFASCSKDNKIPGVQTGAKFQPSDFSVEIISTDNPDESYFEVKYEVKNLTSKRYDVVSNGGNSFYLIKFTVKTSDGAQYQSESPIPDLDGGNTASESQVISVTPGKTIDISTLKYEIILYK